MPGSSSWISYAAQGVKGLDNDDDDIKIKREMWSHKTGTMRFWVTDIFLRKKI